MYSISISILASTKQSLPFFSVERSDKLNLRQYIGRIRDFYMCPIMRFLYNTVSSQAMKVKLLYHNEILSQFKF